MSEVGDPEKGKRSLYVGKEISHRDSPIEIGHSKYEDTDSGATEKSGHSLPASQRSEIQQMPVVAVHPQQPKSHSSFTGSRSISIVPRSKRRGLLGRFTIIPEVERPIEYQRKQKWLITMFVALAAAAAPMGSAIFYRKLSLQRLT